jgi:hypothetical protein
MQTIVSFSSVSLSGSPGSSSDLLLGFLGNLFGGFLGGLFTLPHHIDFSAAVEIGFLRQLADWICCSGQNHPMVVDFIPGGIRTRFPQFSRSVSELCLGYETDSNRDRWEAVGT